MYQHVPQLYNVNHAIYLLACIAILKLTRLQVQAVVRKIPHAAEQLSLRATTTEAVLWSPGPAPTEALAP